MGERSYLNFDLIIERVGGKYRARIFDSPAGQASTEFDIPFSQLELENFVLRMGRPRSGVRRIESSEMEAVKGCGERLFRAVFKDDVYAAFLRSRDCALEESQGLRVRLRIDVPEFHDYPWEYLYNAHLNQFLALSRETPVVRYLELPYPVQPLTVQPPLKVLVMISSPEGFPQLQVEEEWMRLSNALTPLARRGLVMLERLKKPTLSALQQHLRRGEYHIFHFIGHGKYSEHKQDGMLLLEEESGQGRAVSGQYLGTVLHDHRSLRLVVLNACEGARTSQEDPYAGVAQTLVLQGIPAVIAMQFEILETAAITFAQEFYGAVADGFPVDAAISEARKGIFAAGNDVEWGTPVLYMRTPQGVIFEIPEAQRVKHPMSDEPISYVDKELEQKLEGLYTEGLAAFWVEDWDKACDRFQKILADRPDHAAASAKLAEAKRQRQWSLLYARAVEAQQAGNWSLALQALEELQKDSPDYKDAGTTLKIVKKQKQLADLYAEAKKLHAAQKWEAVAKVFNQLYSLDSTYPDPENLLPTAEKELAELKRQAELKELYSHAVRAMDAGRWEQAQTLLRQVQEKEAGFLETERLLSKAEAKIRQFETEKRRQDQVNTLYEQAHGLLRSKKWRKALDKIEEIRELDEQFDDPEKIAEQAQEELAREEQEAERQNELAAMYAEAVRLLREEKYQEALEKWQEIKSIDPRYPDRQKVQQTARRSLAALAKPVTNKPRIRIPKSIWIGVGGIVTIALVILAWNLIGNKGEQPSSPEISAITSVPGGKAAAPTATKTPAKTSTTSQPTATQTMETDKTGYDNFNGDDLNTSLWSTYRYGAAKATSVEQNGGILELKYTGIGEFGITPIKLTRAKIVEPIFYEAKIYLEPSATPTGTQMFIGIDTDDGWTACFISNSGNEKQQIGCSGTYFGIDFTGKIGMDNLYPSWHTIRIEYWPQSLEIAFFIDGMLKGTLLGKDFSKAQEIFEQKYPSVISVNMNNFIENVSPIGYVDFVRSGKVVDDPTIYDNFNDTEYDGKFDTTKWAYEQRDVNGSVIQQDGVLVFTQSGINKAQILQVENYWPYKLQDSVVFEANLKIDMTRNGFVVFGIWGDVVEISCGLHSMSDWVAAHCWTPSGDPHIAVKHGTWHTVRLVINVDERKSIVFIDDIQLAEDSYTRPLKGSNIYLRLEGSVGLDRVKDTRPVVGYVDNVRVMPLGYVNP